jgi:hypothetical protein
MTMVYLPNATLPALVELERFEPKAGGQCRRGPELWLRLPGGQEFPMYTTVSATPLLEEFIRANSIYGGDAHLDRNHYLEVIFREDGTALVAMKYQQILGGRWLTVVPQAQVREFMHQGMAA